MPGSLKITPSAGKPGTEHAIARKITFSRGTNRVFDWTITMNKHNEAKKPPAYWTLPMCPCIFMQFTGQNNGGSVLAVQCFYWPNNAIAACVGQKLPRLRLKLLFCLFPNLCCGLKQIKIILLHLSKLIQNHLTSIQVN